MVLRQYYISMSGSLMAYCHIIIMFSELVTSLS
jgi:hypothetical protein